MQLISKILALSLAGIFAIPAIPAFASDTCVSLETADLRICTQNYVACTSDPTTCNTYHAECITQAHDDYEQCLKDNNPPGTCDPNHQICGVTYRSRKYKIFDPNRLLIDIVFQPTLTAPKSKKS